MIDLHLHTCHSDGADETEDVLKKAQELGLTVISLTDHNTVAAYGSIAEGFGLPPVFTGHVIPGVEITCMYKGEVVEVLGYGIDLSIMEQELREHVLTFESKQKAEFKLLCDAFTVAGVDFDPEKVEFDPTKESSRKALLKNINLNPENRRFFSSDESWKVSSAFTRQEVYNPESLLYVDESSLYPDVGTAVEMIHRSGGIAILAHLYEYASAKEMRAELYDIVKKFHLDGVECAHSVFTPEQIADLNGFCLSHDLLQSGGSDYHGTRKPDVEMGTGRGQLAISEDYLGNWPEEILQRDIR